MSKEKKGIKRNAFYLRNSRGDTLKSLWGRTQGSNMELFDYEENKDGKIVIVEHSHK